MKNLKQANHSIGKKVLIMFLTVALSGLIVSMALSIGNMLEIRDSSISSNAALGNEVADKSEEALIAQMKQNISTLAQDRSSVNAASTLSHFLSYVVHFSDYITTLYQQPEHFLLQNARPPASENGGKYTLQLTLEDDTNAQEISADAKLLANAQYIFDPVIRENSNIITSIYVASEQGFMLSYDTDSDLTQSQYFNFKQSKWYQDIKSAQQPMFTQVYIGSFGRGLMTTCAAPYYDQNGSFAGAVCLDMRLEDIHREIIDIDISQGSVAYLTDRSGNIIAGPHVDYQSSDFMTLSDADESPEFASVISDITAGKNGVSETAETFYAYAPIDYVDWSLVIRVPRDDIIQPVKEMRQSIGIETESAKDYIGGKITSVIASLIGVLAASILVITYVAYRFTKKLVAPIQDMQHQVSVISQGNLDAEVAITTDDEIGVLAREFNNMASSLKDYIKQIERVTAERERIGAELNVATQIQASMLPSIFPPFPDRTEFDIFATMDPAKEVGGDFYDFFFVDRLHLAVVIADVSGKGVPAALFMVIAKTLIKDYAGMSENVEDVFTLVNEKLCEANKEGLFVTAWMGVLDLLTGHMEYVNAGHNPPLICHTDGSFEYLKQKPGLMLAGMDQTRYRKGEFDLGPGDTLYLYTDGVTEAADCEEKLYGEKRLKDVLNAHADAVPRDLLAAVKEDIIQYMDGAPQADDITMLGLRLNAIEPKSINFAE